MVLYITASAQWIMATLFSVNQLLYELGNYACVLSWSVLTRAKSSRQHRICFCIFLLLLICGVDKLSPRTSQASLIFHKNLIQMEDAKSPGSVCVCYDCAMLLLRVRFSSLEIKNVHSHKLEMTLVLPFLFQKVGFTSPMKYAVVPCQTVLHCCV